MDSPAAVLLQLLESNSLLLRGQRVLADADVAAFYQVQTQRVERAVLQNRQCFPTDFVWELTPEEHVAVSRADPRAVIKSRRRPQYFFTGAGIAMLASVLRSPRAIAVNIALIRTLAGPRET